MTLGDVSFGLSALLYSARHSNTTLACAFPVLFQMSQPTCQGFVSMDADLWTESIEHPFLQRCRDATIPQHCFDWWLQQDYGFVLNFQQLSKTVLNQAPEEDKPTFINGLAALDAELKFYQAQAASRGPQESGQLSKYTTRLGNVQDLCSRPTTYMQSAGAARTSATTSTNLSSKPIMPCQTPARTRPKLHVRSAGGLLSWR
ncbi:hypothetical protein WJX84_010155 [Apatococcus fuscideae]|uniref:Thiaminase-2/PQQC domain-containing protein n=1 Tax=Apatococcus fuscideae TaxID=2026836 RepID=A0AAW1RLC3_9CHLO